jgi:hypothetical protein
MEQRMDTCGVPFRLVLTGWDTVKTRHENGRRPRKIRRKIAHATEEKPQRLEDEARRPLLRVNNYEIAVIE